MSTLDTAALGRRVAQLRREQGYSQRELADLVNISFGYIGQIESGRLRKRPSDEILSRIAAALSVPVSELYVALGVAIEPPTPDDIAFSGLLSLTPERRREVDRLIDLLKREQAEEERRRQREAEQGRKWGKEGKGE